MAFIELLRSVPEVIWSGIIGSLLTLLGVMLVNSSNTKRLKLQLAHESEEKARQRRAELRRDVYLEAAEELVKASSYLASLPRADLSKQEVGSPLQGFFAAAAKLQMVSDTTTAALVSDLVSAYGELLLKIFGLVRPIHSARSSANDAAEQYELCQTEVRRVLAAMTQHNESGSTDAAAFDRLNRSFEFQHAQSEKYAKERSQHTDQAIKLELAFLRAYVPELKNVGLKTMKVMVEVRRELELHSDVDAFTELLETQWKRMDSALDALLKSVERA